MAINRADYYPGRYDASPDHPEGAFKNKSSDLAVDGSYIEKTWANDWGAFFSSILAGAPANGTPDVVGASQLFSALIDLIVPVGVVIFVNKPDNPAGAYPGTTWQRIAEGRYIASVGQHTDAAPNAETKTLPYGNLVEGKYRHALTEAENAAHTHSYGVYSNKDVLGSGDDPLSTFDGGGGDNTTQASGSGDPHNNMPPGFALYVWERLPNP